MYGEKTLDAWWASAQKKDAREWLRVSAETGAYVQELTGKDNIIAVVEPGVAMGNLAVWLPEKAELQVDADKCAEGINPADIDMATAVGRLRNAPLTGGCTHEGGHALASLWPLDQSPERRAVVQAALLLEEARSERRMIQKHPETRTFLRAGFHGLVKGADDPTDIAGAARLAALGMARVDAGVLEAAEMEPVKALLVDLLTEELYEALRKVWIKTHSVEDDDQAAMEALGQEWLDLLPEEAKEGGEGIEIIVCGGFGEGDGEDGEGEGSGNGIIVRIAEAISEAAQDEAEGKVDAAKAHDAAVARKSEASENRKAEEAAKGVFDKGPSGHGVGPGTEGISGSVNPTPEVRAAANVLARAIERAQHRARSKTVVSSAVPPGRLRSSAAVRRSAQRAQGIPVTAEPWKQTIRRHVENPPITCGIACDISGSMRWAERPVAEAAWAIATAIHRNDGDSATVAYGNSVHAVTKPGERSQKMRTFNAMGGMENIVGALRALDGGLSLSNGNGVRLLVNISDGVYTHAQKSGAEVLFKRLIANGVKVVWIDLNHGGSDPVRMKGIEVVSVRRGEPDLVKIIGAAITKSLSAA